MADHQQAKTNWPTIQVARYRGGDVVWLDKGEETKSVETKRYVPEDTSLRAELEAEVERLRKSAPPEERWCDCIMAAHCSKSKPGRCRGAAFGTSGEGSPGVASAPRHPNHVQADRLQSILDKHKEKGA